MKRFVEIILVIMGSAFVVLGVIGIFMPLLPTTPFLLLGASCYIKGSPKLYSKLIGNKYLGIYIKNYREGNGIPKKTKIIAITMLWITISYSIVFIVDNIYIRGCLVLIAASVTWHIISRKTLVQAKKEELADTEEIAEYPCIGGNSSMLNVEDIVKEEI